MTLSNTLSGFAALALIVSLGSTANAQTLTPAQQQAIQTILTQHQAQSAPLRAAITIKTGEYLTDVSAVVPPPAAPRFVAFTQQFAQASARAFAHFGSLPAPMQTAQVAATLVSTAVLPPVGSLATDLNLPGPVATSLGQRTQRYAVEIAPAMAALQSLRRLTAARIKAVTGTP